MRRSIFAAALLLSALLASDALAQQGPESVMRGTKQFSRKVLASGLAGPFEITWGPDNMLWVTERTGKRITRIDPASGEQHVAITIDEVSAPGGQDGLIGLALHPELLRGTGNDYIYVFYTYVDRSKGPDERVPDDSSPYRYLYGKLVRLSYHQADGTLSDPVDLLTGLPAGNDHVAGRLKFGPDSKLYLTIGDQGNDQLGNFCLPTQAQRLPTQQEINDEYYEAYEGKSLRINLDGSIPEDNPEVGGVVSHLYTYGHRNPQGIDFGPDGTLYESEHGPKTDDELNILKPGGNYGWPHVAGLKDNKAYEYARWAEAKVGCENIKFSDLEIDPSVPRDPESAFTKPFNPPIATMFTVPTGYNFHDPACGGIDYICWPTVGASSVEYYAAGPNGIPGWDHVLLVTTLKRGSLYVATLSADGQSVVGNMSRYFQSDNRYRDLEISPDRRTIYIATDPRGLAEATAGGVTRTMQDPGAILAFTYQGEGAAPAQPQQVSQAAAPSSAVRAAVQPAPAAGDPPHYTAAQADAGKTAYMANCAVCHGNTLTNGTYGTPLAGAYFEGAWSGLSVADLFDHASGTMPPDSPGSLPVNVYAEIVAYILQVNGVPASDAALPDNREDLAKMKVP